MTAEIDVVVKDENGQPVFKPTDNGDAVRITVGPKSTVRYAMNLGTTFPIIGDTVHMMVLVSSGFAPLALHRFTVPGSALAANREKVLAARQQQ